MLAAERGSILHEYTMIGAAAAACVVMFPTRGTRETFTASVMALEKPENGSERTKAKTKIPKA